MEGCLWEGYAGHVRIGALQPYTVIDKCAASIRDLPFRVGSGGQRVYGLRPLEPDASLRHQNRAFFQGLKASLHEEGQRLPILVWGVNGKLYVRYGASRVWAARELGWTHVAAVLCDFHSGTPASSNDFSGRWPLDGPAHILETGFWDPRIVGDFEASHERLDAHRMEPPEIGPRFKGRADG